MQVSIGFANSLALPDVMSPEATPAVIDAIAPAASAAEHGIGSTAPKGPTCDCTRPDPTAPTQSAAAGHPGEWPKSTSSNDILPRSGRRIPPSQTLTLYK